MHLGWPLGGAKSLLEAVSFKKTTEGKGRGKNFELSWSCDLDLYLGSGQMAYRCASCIDLLSHRISFKSEFFADGWMYIKYICIQIHTYVHTM